MWYLETVLLSLSHQSGPGILFPQIPSLNPFTHPFQKSLAIFVLLLEFLKFSTSQCVLTTHTVDDYVKKLPKKVRNGIINPRIH